MFNHPFLFFLRNTQTGDILFAGRMSQPEAAKQPVFGPVSEPQLPEQILNIFTPEPATGARVPVSNTLNPATYNINTYRPSLPASSTFNTNPSPSVPQIQPTMTNFYSSPNNVNTGNNFPPSAHSQTYQSPIHLRSIGNDQSQLNTAQYQPYGNSEVHHASNPDTIGIQRVPAMVQFLSTSGSHASSTNGAQYQSDVNKTPQSGVRDTNQSYNDKIHFSA